MASEAYKRVLTGALKSASARGRCITQDEFFTDVGGKPNKLLFGKLSNPPVATPKTTHDLFPEAEGVYEGPQETLEGLLGPRSAPDKQKT